MSEDANRRSITMIGGPNTGKSHFTFQLYGRLRAKRSGLKLREMPNEELFREGLERLSNGLAAEHTSVKKYDNTDLLVVDGNGDAFDLLWPDYGGEQITRILKNRSVESDWEKRLEATEGLLVFIRPTEIIDYKDLIEHPIDVKLKQRIEGEGINPDITLELQTQAGLVEMLQILLYSVKRNSANPVSSPKLGVVLTCWDEIDDQDVKPAIFMQERFPLLYQFICSTWEQNSVIIQGLSSLECTLDKKDQNGEFVEKGPCAFGYVVSPSGEHSPNLTLLISRMLKMLDED